MSLVLYCQQLEKSGFVKLLYLKEMEEKILWQKNMIILVQIMWQAEFL